jgi:hypothetical protein
MFIDILAVAYYATSRDITNIAQDHLFGFIIKTMYHSFYFPPFGMNRRTSASFRG